jgi:hypothetical protein
VRLTDGEGESLDTKRRELGCKCQQEEGDSPCPVHGLEEPPADSEVIEYGPEPERPLPWGANDIAVARWSDNTNERAAVHRVNNWPALHAEVTRLRAQLSGVQDAADWYRDECLKLLRAEQAKRRENANLYEQTEETLITRYQKVAAKLWAMFPSDPLPTDDPAQGWCERLESLIARGLIGPIRPAGEVARLALRGAALKAVRRWCSAHAGYREDCLKLILETCPHKDGVGWLIQIGEALDGAEVLDADAVVPLLSASGDDGPIES